MGRAQVSALGAATAAAGTGANSHQVCTRMCMCMCMCSGEVANSHELYTHVHVHVVATSSRETHLLTACRRRPSLSMPTPFADVSTQTRCTSGSR